MARPGDPFRRANRKIRTLTNASTRNDRPGFKPRARNGIEGKRGIRRLIKRNPADGLSQPFADKMTSTKVGGGPGTDAVPNPAIVMKSDKTPPTSQGKTVIRPAVVPVGKRLKQGQ
jgi:hypothetical protein